MVRHNKYLLPILAYIAKCAEVSETEMDEAIQSFTLQVGGGDGRHCAQVGSTPS